MKKLTRLEFFRLFVPFFVILGLGKWAAACGGSGSSDDGTDGGNGTTQEPDCLNAGTNVSIATNHGHQLTVSRPMLRRALRKRMILQAALHMNTALL